MRFSFQGQFVLSALAACALAAAACSDSIHLDPEPTPGSNVGGGGGGAPIPCASSSDCPAPTGVCDTVKGICVECLSVSDCAAQEGTVCSEGSCVCPVAGESFCDKLGNQPARCVNLSTSTNDCGSCGRACFGACAGGQCAEPWEQTSLVDAPQARYAHVAVASDTQMIIWGGNIGNNTVTNTGGVYDVATRRWSATSLVNAPSPREQATAVWTGSQMIVWGGYAGGPLGDGGIYDPASNTWAAVSTDGAPSARYQHTAVWTGSQMIIWGGTSTGPLGDGAVFTPSADGTGGTWSAVEPTGAPQARAQHSAVWAEAAGMLIFGGYDSTAVPPAPAYLGDAAAYDPGSSSWSPIDTTNGPGPRSEHTAVWTGTHMLIWGGYDGGTYLGSGKEYNPSGGSWLDMNDPSPSGRHNHTAVWVAGPDRMVVWGGAPGPLGTGGVYNRGDHGWTMMPTAPQARQQHTAVAVGSTMILWGGNTGSPTNTGAVFDVSAFNALP